MHSSGYSSLYSSENQSPSTISRRRGSGSSSSPSFILPESVAPRRRSLSSSNPPNSFVISDTADREVPNTSGVVVWPEKILNEIKVLEQYDREQRKREHLKKQQEQEILLQQLLENENKEDQFFVEKIGLTETSELYLMLAVVAILWWVGSYYLLKQHKFPFHKHYIEAAAIFILPVIFIVSLFCMVDKIYNYYKSKEKEKSA